MQIWNWLRFSSLYTIWWASIRARYPRELVSSKCRCSSAHADSQGASDRDARLHCLGTVTGDREIGHEMSRVCGAGFVTAPADPRAAGKQERDS